MKRIGFIALALVTLLATLGIGFSMWSQTVTITGNVNTGNVTLQVSNYTGTVAYKDSTGALVFSDSTLAMGPIPTAGAGALWGPSYAFIHDVNGATDNAPHSCTSEAGLTVNLWYQNLFPVPAASAGTFRPWEADFDITNTGSIPVKLEVTAPSITDSTVGVTGMPAIAVSYTTVGGGTTIAAEGYQIEPNGVVHVSISLTVNEQTVQSYNGHFSLLISGVQWNEYTAPGATNTIVPRT
jgi:hypothetical protein